MTAKQFWGPTALGTFGSLIVIGAIALPAAHCAQARRSGTGTHASPAAAAAGPDARRTRGHRRAEGETQAQRRPHGDLRVLGQQRLIDLRRGHRAGRSSGLHFGAGERSSATAAGPGTGADATESQSPNPCAHTDGVEQSAGAVHLRSRWRRSTFPPGQQAILASPELRSYLDKHCPLESGCAGGQCPLTAGKTPSYRFLPVNLDVSRLTPVWQQTAAAVAGKPLPWMIAVNEAGQTVIDQAWPASVEETLKLLKKFGGQ